MNMKFSFSALSDPEQCAASLWKRVPGYIRLTFCSAVVFALAAHLYMLTNKFTNHDDVGSLFGNTYGAASGRWLRPFILRLSGSFSMPWLVGLMSVLCLAAVACLTVSALRIRRPLGCMLTAAILVTFPTVMCTFTYMYTAFAYFFSLLLAVFGAWAALRWGWRGSAAGVVTIALSLSIYQSYFPVAAVLTVSALLFETLDGERPFKALFLRGLRLLGTLIAALAVYMLSVRLTTGGHLVSYMGLETMGRISLKELPGLIGEAYQKYYLFFWLDETDSHFRPFKYAFLLTASATAAVLVLLLIRRRLGPSRTALAAALFAVCPLAANLIYIMVPEAEVHTLMIYGLCYILVIPIALAEYSGPVLREGAARRFHSAVSWVVLLTMAMTVYSYIIVDNNTYFKLDMSMRQCQAYSNRLLERIEACDGYQPTMSVVLVGSNVWEDDLISTPEMGPNFFTGPTSAAGLRSAYSYQHYLRSFLSFTQPVYLGNTAEGKAAAELEEVQSMPRYPTPGSIRVIDDTVVVKLN